MESALRLQPIRQLRAIHPLSGNLGIAPSDNDSRTQGFNTKPFVEANTKEVTMHHLQSDCVVPVFSKDNEVTISHPAFVETVHEAAQQFLDQGKPYHQGQNPRSNPQARESAFGDRQDHLL